MNLIPARFRRLDRATREARDAYFAIDENPRTGTARDTLRDSTKPADRAHALKFLADRELGLYRLHDAAFGFDPWPQGAAGDAATGLAHGVMILCLLHCLEADRNGWGSWRDRHTPTAWGRPDLDATERALAETCGPLLDQLSVEDDPTEHAVLYTRLWITADPIIGGQAAEWIAVLGQDWTSRAAEVKDGPATVLTLPDAGARAT